MKTISQDVKLQFSAIEFKDALALLPLFNLLISTYNFQNLEKFYKDLPCEERENYLWPRDRSKILSIEEIKAAIDTLKAFGFEHTVDIVEPSLDLLKSKK